MLAMAEVNTSRTEKMPTAVLCARERTMLRDRRCRASGKSCRYETDELEAMSSRGYGHPGAGPNEET